MKLKEVKKALTDIENIPTGLTNALGETMLLKNMIVYASIEIKKDFDILKRFISEVEQIQKDGVDYMSKCVGLHLAFSQFKKGTNEYKRIEKLAHFIEYRIQDNDEMEKTLLYIAQLISKNEFDSFIKDHIGKAEEDIVSDMKYEMEHNLIEEDDSYSFPKTKSEVL